MEDVKICVGNRECPTLYCPGEAIIPSSEKTGLVTSIHPKSANKKNLQLPGESQRSNTR